MNRRKVFIKDKNFQRNKYTRKCIIFLIKKKIVKKEKYIEKAELIKSYKKILKNDKIDTEYFDKIIQNDEHSEIINKPIVLINIIKNRDLLKKMKKILKKRKILNQIHFMMQKLKQKVYFNYK